WLLMAWNLWATVRAGKAVNGETTVTVETAPTAAAATPSAWALLFSRPMFFVVALLTLSMLLGFADLNVAVFLIVGIGALAVAAMLMRGESKPGEPKWHALLEGKPLLFTVL